MFNTPVNGARGPFTPSPRLIKCKHELPFGEFHLRLPGLKVFSGILPNTSCCSESLPVTTVFPLNFFN